MIVECGLYAAARNRFALRTGIQLSRDNYVSVMALDGQALNIDPADLASALYRLLACIYGARYSTNNSSVAHSLGNQGRFAVADPWQLATDILISSTAFF